MMEMNIILCVYTESFNPAKGWEKKRRADENVCCMTKIISSCLKNHEKIFQSQLRHILASTFEHLFCSFLTRIASF